MRALTLLLVLACSACNGAEKPGESPQGKPRSVPTSDQYQNMAAVCVGVSTDLTGRPIKDCAWSSQKFVRVIADSWVRRCTLPENAQQCTFTQLVWSRFNKVPALDYVEVCTAMKTPGDAAGGTGASCPASGSTGTFAGMKQVHPDRVALVPPLPPSSAFTATPTSGVSPLDVKLAWNVPNMPGGTPCQASGDWSGPKAASGSEDQKSLMKDSHFTLSCVWSKDLAVLVAWQKPTTSTDGTPLTNLSGFLVQYGQDPQTLSQSQGAAADMSSAVVKDFYFKADQQWFFAVRAVANDSNQSDPSNIVPVTLVKPAGAGAAPFTGTVDVTITGKPNAPTGATAKQIDDAGPAPAVQQQ